MNILVTGCAGFIGFHLSKNLLEQGFKVYGVDSLNDYYDPSLKEDRLMLLKAYNNFYFSRGDISSADTLLYLKDIGIDIVIHLAAQAGVRFSIESPQSYTQSNLVGFANVLEFCRSKSSRLIFASTSSVYGQNENFPFSVDEIADHPIQYYAATKRANEIMAHSYSSMFSMEAIGLRFFTVYGPYGRPDMALFKFTKNILEDLPIDVYNNGDHVRDFTYIDDIVSGIISCIDFKFKKIDWDAKNPKPHISKASFRIFNLGNGNPVKLMDYINFIERFLNKKAKINFLPLQTGDVKETLADISLTRQDLGFSPKTNVEEGIKNFINWYRSYYGC